MSAAIDPEVALVFLEEARGHLRSLEDPTVPPAEKAGAAHALKSAAGLVGLSELRAAAETAERYLRAREVGPAEEHVSRAAALLRSLAAELEPVGGGSLGEGSGFDPEEQAMLRSFFLDEAGETLEGMAETLIALEREPGRRDLVDVLLRKTHTLKGSAATVGLRAAAEAAHRLEDVFAHLRSGRLTISAPLLDALVGAVDVIRAIAAAEDPAHARDLLSGLVAQLAAVGAGQRPRVEVTPTPVPVPVEAEISDPHRHVREGSGSGSNPRAERDDSPTRDEDTLFEERRANERRVDPRVLRVDVGRVDALVDAAGELVFDRTRIERRATELRQISRELGKTRAALRLMLGPLRAAGSAAEAGKPPSPEAIYTVVNRIAELEADLAVSSAHLARTTANLSDDTEALRRTSSQISSGLTQVRMMSVRGLFQRLARPLREAARTAGKRVELVVAGEDTELDKTVAEQIVDPLLQILRNAVVHGIEAPERRHAAGKRGIGRIHMNARHQGDSVFLEVADDGAGIDVRHVREILLDAGSYTPAQVAALTDEQVIAAIFQPGFSTRSEADELSGRGVGLDVVRESISRLGGEIVVHSTLGQGTRFVIRLPLTTAVTQALLFKVGGQVYALPNVHVLETAQVEQTAARLPTRLRLRDETVPLVSLHELLGAERPDTKRVPAVVIEFAGRRLAATCDKVVGPREIVVKSIGPLLSPLGLYAGATISGAGKVQLILDSAALAQLAYPPLVGADGVPMAIEHSGSTTGQAVMASVRGGRDTGGHAVLRPASLSQPPQFPPRRLLVVDDARTVRETIARLLAGAGYIVDSAVDGAEAWEMLKDVEYDLMVTDLEMPRLDGYQLLEKVRANPTTKLMPVLVVSSRSTEAHRTRAQQLGANAFLAKPVQKPGLLETVTTLLA